MRLQCRCGKTMVLRVLVQDTEVTLWTGADLNVFPKLIPINILRTLFPHCLSCINTCQKPSHQFPGKVQVERFAGESSKIQSTKWQLSELKAPAQASPGERPGFRIPSAACALTARRNPALF